MFTILTCHGYTPEATTRSLDDAIALCGELEIQEFQSTGDCWARVVRSDGQFVADAEGPYESHRGAPPYDAATATGMYDHD